MDLRFCDIYILSLMILMSLTGILSERGSAPSWKPKSRPANHDSIVSKTEGNDIKLTCGANGNPEPSIIWYKDGRLFDETARPKSKVHKYTLTIKDATVEDKGDYQCLVTNNHGSINFTFIVEVIKMTWPLELEEPDNVTVTEGEDAIFTCRPLNDPSASVKWVKRNQTGVQTSIGQTSDFLDTGAKEMLVIKNAQRKDAGHYTCLVGNYFGIKQVDAWLNVLPRTTTTTTTTTTTRTTVTTTTPTTTKTTPTTTKTTPTTTKTTPTPTTTTPSTTTTEALITSFFPEPTPEWDNIDFDDDEEDEEEQRKKDKKKKKKNNKKKNRKNKKKKNKKNRNKNREDENTDMPDYEESDTNHIPHVTPDDWFRRTDRIKPDEEKTKWEQDTKSEKYNPKHVDNNGLFPYEEKGIKKVDSSGNDNIDNSAIEFNNGMPGEKTQQKQSEDKDIDVWTIYIIVGSVAGGVLLIGVVAIVVALCCNRYEDEGYKHTNV